MLLDNPTLIRRRLLLAALLTGLLSPDPAAEADADEPLSEEVRKELVDLPRRYRAADDAAARRAVLERAVALGSKGVARLRPVVEGEVRAELRKYQPLFQRALTTLGAQPDSKLSVDAVVNSSEPLAAQRERLVEATKLADVLGPDPDAEGAAVMAFSEQLDALELAAVERMELARSMRTLDAAERAVVEGINRERSQRGLRPLSVDPALCRAAKGHSHDMMRLGFFSHESPVPGRESFAKRAKLAGTRAAAENIAKGGSGGQVVERWMASDGHRRNILSESRRLGVGRSGGYYTAVFGR